jgi:hypothetical protein
MHWLSSSKIVRMALFTGRKKIEMLGHHPPEDNYAEEKSK